jgi:NitT/TauT family transport system substrate-binding protein
MRRVVLLAALLLSIVATQGARAEDIKVGALKSIGAAPLYLAQEHGYFAAQGLNAQLVYFDASQPIVLATVSGDVDIGVTGTTGGFFSLAGQGALRLIGGYSREVPGFNFNAFIVSSRAYAAGLHSFSDLPGHSFAISQTGSPNHYAVALIADKYHFDLASLHILALQSIGNIASAVTGGQADAAFLLGTPAIPLIQRGDAKLLGWSGDETPWQLGALFVATKTANDRGPLIEKFLRAYRQGARDYYTAFVGTDGKRQDGPTAAATLDILAKATGLTVDQARAGVIYIDPDERIDEDDVMRQANWYHTQGMVKETVDRATLFDARYVIPLPKP